MVLPGVKAKNQSEILASLELKDNRNGEFIRSCNFKKNIIFFKHQACWILNDIPSAQRRENV